MATAREIGSFGGLRIVFSVNALEATKVRKFPASRHRSQRIRKKLMKRFGTEFVMVPCMFRTPTSIIAHPSFKARLCAALSDEVTR
jgi:hypothetical protein